MKPVLAKLFVIILFAGFISEANSSDDTETYVVKKGDSLWSIAKAKYDDAMKWRKIYEANRYIGPSLQIHVGQILSIPTVTKGSESPQPSSPANIETIPGEIREAADSVKVVNDDTLLQSEQRKTALVEMNAALEMLVGSLRDNNIEAPHENTTPIQHNASNPDSSETEYLPVFSLVFVTQPDNQTRKKYFVNNFETLAIKRDTLEPVTDKVPDSDSCRKTRMVAKIIEKRGTFVANERYEAGEAYHIKRMIFSDSERYYTYILTNINENFRGFSTLKEPLDVLRVRIFSSHGSIYLTDKGLQGAPGFFFAADENGVQLLIDPNDPVVGEKYDKAVTMFLDAFNVSTERVIGPEARKKLDMIY